MEVDRSELAENYETLSDNELLAQHLAGTLTDLAYEVLEAELAERGIAIPKRPEASDALQGRPQSLRAHWQGQASLASAYWLIGMLGSLVFALLFNLLGSQQAALLVFLAWIPYTVFALVSIWRCAWNTSWKGWGYIARALVLLNVASVFAALLSAL